ncbi:hypothetical protein GCM10012289_20550 [Nonomuraea cavernae]|uniref:Uncharacterized protein n=1 Tax=Nonomuraea cavernae TaxID=2045107 RepID=A0A917YWM9_9ACTN|nr:hypothetical protein GCM10012289_20550 [Nonomuraea cavernae]
MGIVAVTTGVAAWVACVGGADSGDWALIPATPGAWAQAPVINTAPATAANRPICPESMISTRVTVYIASFTFVADEGNGEDTFSALRSLR